MAMRLGRGEAADGKAILTITYPEFRFQFGFLIAKGNARSALRKLALLKKLLGADYAAAFECNLSDNGPEFARFGEGFMEAIGIRRIQAKEVCLKPSLLK